MLVEDETGEFVSNELFLMLFVLDNIQYCFWNTPALSVSSLASECRVEILNAQTEHRLRCSQIHFSIFATSCLYLCAWSGSLHQHW